MGFGQAVRSGFDRYFEFNGRSARSEYWYFYLFLLLGNFAANFLDAVVVGRFVLSPVFFLATFIPAVALGVRRLHDLGRSGWWWLLVYVPVLGAVLMVVWGCLRGEETGNRYGRSPLSAAGGPDEPFASVGGH